MLAIPFTACCSCNVFYSRIGAGLGDYLPQLETLVLTHNNLEELVTGICNACTMHSPDSSLLNIQKDLDPLASISTLKNLRYFISHS